METPWRRRLLLLTAGLAAALGASCFHKPAAPARRAVPVATDRVASGEVPTSLTGIGQIQAFNTYLARAQVEGQIFKIQFVEGQQVRRGTPLAQIDPRPYQATVAQDEANIARDQANLAVAEADLERYQHVTPGLVSAQQLQTQGGLVAQLRAAVAADKAALQRDRVMLSYTSVRSPIDGVTGVRLIDVGNLVGPNDPQGLVAISQLQPIATLFVLPQSDLPAIRDAMVAAGRAGLQVEVYPQGDQSRRLDVGRLALINNQVSLTSGTITLKAYFPNAKKLLWPGEFVDARVILARRANGLTVPSSVVQRGVGNATYAWVVNPNGTVAQRPIRVSATLATRAVVQSGLSAGEEVVTDGQFALTPGAHITRVARPGARAPVQPQLLKNTSQDNIELTP
jgi:membrane fusion protein, multidrug efflux system